VQSFNHRNVIGRLQILNHRLTLSFLNKRSRQQHHAQTLSLSNKNNDYRVEIISIGTEQPRNGDFLNEQSYDETSS
jgi:hypothetical protein